MNLTFSDMLELRIAVVGRICELWHRRHKHQSYREQVRDNLNLLRKLRAITKENYL